MNLKKIKSLLIPYLISNASVVCLSLFLYYFFNYDILNRLSFDYKLITEGILSLNSPPIDPPTYFIRDLFMIFVFVEFIQKQNFKLLLIILPVAFFGELFLRYDTIVLFVIGILISNFDVFVSKYKKYIILILFLMTIIVSIFATDYCRQAIALLIFLSVYKLDIKFKKVGGFTYLLHLYHSPTMVALFPIISIFVSNDYISLPIQILGAYIIAYLLYLITQRFKFFKILSGGR